MNNNRKHFVLVAHGNATKAMQDAYELMQAAPCELGVYEMVRVINSAAISLKRLCTEERIKREKQKQ